MSDSLKIKVPFVLDDPIVGRVSFSEKQIDAVYKPLAELMIEHTKEFPGFKLEKSNDKLSLSFEFESKSTLVKSALCFDAENNQFIRIR